MTKYPNGTSKVARKAFNIEKHFNCDVVKKATLAFLVQSLKDGVLLLRLLEDWERYFM